MCSCVCVCDGGVVALFCGIYFFFVWFLFDRLLFVHESVCVSVHATPCRKFGSLCLTKSAAAARAIETDCECSGHEFV